MIFAVAVGLDQADFVGEQLRRRPAVLRRGSCICEGPALQAGLDTFRERAEVADALQFVIGQFDAEMIFQAGEQFQRLQAVDAQFLEEIVVWGQRARVAPGNVWRRGPALPEWFAPSVRMASSIIYATSLCALAATIGRGSRAIRANRAWRRCDSTNFFKAAITGGRVNSSQKRSISLRSSSCGMGLRNFLAAARV